jgi:O-antigen ligase
MSGRLSRLLPFIICSLFAVYMVIFQPGYLTSAQYLGGLICLEILVAVLYSYRRSFFPLLLLVFIGAGTVVPLQEVWVSGRWLVLGLGAFAGFIIYMRESGHSFGMFHLVAFACVLTAIISATVSSFPHEALFKALSLLLLFLYGASGARLAVTHKKEAFSQGLLAGCEILVYLTAISYFILHHDLFGNPNSLGAVMGVVAAPCMLWGILVSERGPNRWHRTLAFLLSLFLLFSSYARAGIMAAAVSCFLICLILRRYRLLMALLGTAVLEALVVATMLFPQSAQPQSATSIFLHKGHDEAGVLTSRRSNWDTTISSIQEHPWFGTGFGTSNSGNDVENFGNFVSSGQGSREHGSSYLAIIEWVGLLGALPFFTMVILVVSKVSRSLVLIYRSGDSSSLAVPIIAVIAAGLIHAGFEDWLFAVGYYLCVLFWSFAFVLVDILSVAENIPVKPGRVPDSRFRGLTPLVQ